MMTSGGKRKPAKAERAGAEGRVWRVWRDLIPTVSLLEASHSDATAPSPAWPLAA
jgi:hypothetical protein